MSNSIKEMRCPGCKMLTVRQGSEETFWCSCGRHWKAPADQEEEDDQEHNIITVDIPDVVKVELEEKKTKRKRQKGYSFESRQDYLHRHGLLELDILVDNNNQEYWLQDNFITGMSEKKYLPSRFNKGTCKAKN